MAERSWAWIATRPRNPVLVLVGIVSRVGAGGTQAIGLRNRVEAEKTYRKRKKMELRALVGIADIHANCYTVDPSVACSRSRQLFLASERAAASTVVRSAWKEGGQQMIGARPVNEWASGRKDGRKEASASPVAPSFHDSVALAPRHLHLR